MQNQKLEDVLNLSLEATGEEREKSRQLDVGYLEEEKRWELIVKYNGSLQPLSGDLIQVEELIAGYAIVTLPESLIESFAELPEVEYIEKPKRLYFSVLAGKQTSCIPEVTVRDPFLSGKGVLMAILDSGIDYQSPEFQERGGKTRIRYLWDQTLNPKEVDALLTDHNGEFMQSLPRESCSRKNGLMRHCRVLSHYSSCQVWTLPDMEPQLQRLQQDQGILWMAGFREWHRKQNC